MTKDMINRDYAIELLKEYRGNECRAQLAIEFLELHTNRTVDYHQLMCQTQTVLKILRTSSRKGEQYYWVLYHTYFITPVPDTVAEIIDAVSETIGRHLPRTTYYENKAKAEKEFASILKSEIERTS